MRTATINRVTGETDISLTFNLDGQGKVSLDSPLAFLNHMLTLMSRHGFFDLDLKAKGDTDVDFHHTVEDIGICLGQAVAKAAGEKKGICRYGEATVPMDEALAATVIDLCARPCFILKGTLPQGNAGDFAPELLEEFFRAFSNHSGATLHINLYYGTNLHHIIEAVFKSFGRALDKATRLDERIGNTVLSTKGML